MAGVVQQSILYCVVSTLVIIASWKIKKFIALRDLKELES